MLLAVYDRHWGHALIFILYLKSQAGLIVLGAYAINIYGVAHFIPGNLSEASMDLIPVQIADVVGVCSVLVRGHMANVDGA